MKYELFPSLIKEYDVSGYPQKEKLLEKIFSFPTRNHNAVKGGVSSYNFSSNSSNNFLSSNGFKDLENYFLKCSEDYSKEIGIICGKISDSWFNIMDYNSETTRHSHHGATISGAYYPLLENNTCNLIFYSPIHQLQSTWFQKTSEFQNEQKSYSNEFNIIPIKQNHLYIFPGWLEHGTEINRGGKRVVISFNVSPWCPQKD